MVKYFFAKLVKLIIPDEKWFAKKFKPFFIGITDSHWFAEIKIRKSLAIKYKVFFKNKRLHRRMPDSLE